MNPWSACRALTASALPVARACDLRCRFCFSASSLSALPRRSRLADLDVAAYCRLARSKGAGRLVITGGGEPLLDPEQVLRLIAIGRLHFPEIACFTNGSRLTPALARALADAGLSYLCWSRHHPDDAVNRALMGPGAPGRDAVLSAAAGLTVRATCVMARGYVEGRAGVEAYIAALRPYGVRQYTFKHTYTAYPRSVFAGAPEDTWAAAHRVEAVDPFRGEGRILGRLPWGPVVRRIGDEQLCFYREPTPAWELAHRTCRSLNLMADGAVYASLEDRSSLLCRLTASPLPLKPSASSA